MRNFAVIGILMLLISGCKDNERQPAPDRVIETSGDSLRKDTVATRIQKDNVAEIADVVTAEPKIIDATKTAVKVDYASFGSKFIADKVLTKEEMFRRYKALKKGDTINVKFKSTIADVCKKKGCWMKMDLADNNESFVRFTDYGFFVPMNADKSNAIVSGKAYIDEVSVDELKHYAKDGGESKEAIDKITSPKITYAFQADGVLIER